MVIGYTYSIILTIYSINNIPYTVRGVYNHKLAHIDRAESAHGVSWCAEIGRPTYAFATLFGPFLRLTSIRSPLKFQNATPHRVFVQNKNSEQ